MMVLTDYLRTYGEQVFQIMSRESRESVENGYEVTIERYEFLQPKTKANIFDYLTKNYFEQKVITFANEKFKLVKLAQQQVEDNKKELQVDEKLESAFEEARLDFERLHSLVKDLANVLDQDLPNYQIELNKKPQTQMTFKAKEAN